jgi:hypothetical protein
VDSEAPDTEAPDTNEPDVEEPDVGEPGPNDTGKSDSEAANGLQLLELTAGAGVALAIDSFAGGGVVWVTDQNTVVRADDEGSTSWATIIDGAGYTATDLVTTPDGGVAISQVGPATGSYDCTFTDVTNSIQCKGAGSRLVRLDGEGKVLWIKSYPCTITHFSMTLRSLANAPGGGFYLAGGVENAGFWVATSGCDPYFVDTDPQGVLVRTDDAGEILWQKEHGKGQPTKITWGVPTDHYESFFEMAVTADGSLLLFGMQHNLDFWPNTKYLQWALHVAADDGALLSKTIEGVSFASGSPWCGWGERQVTAATPSIDGGAAVAWSIPSPVTLGKPAWFNLINGVPAKQAKTIYPTNELIPFQKYEPTQWPECISNGFMCTNMEGFCHPKNRPLAVNGMDTDSDGALWAAGLWDNEGAHSGWLSHTSVGGEVLFEHIFEPMESAVLNDIVVTASGNVIAVGGQGDTTWLVVVTP